MLSEGTVRILFSKTGKIRYISHLDLCRTLKSAFIRAKIPLKYSEGFNPRPKMVFALTVSVGAESLCELLDIGITEPMEEDDFCLRLGNALTDDIGIIRVYNPTTKFTSLAWSDYTVTAEHPFVTDELDGIFSKPMIVEKHGKKGNVETDIQPLVKTYSAEADRLFLTLSASQSAFLNPEYVMKAINAATDNRYSFYSIVRTSVYDADMKLFE
mgnify:CR=1 FL=1